MGVALRGLAQLVTLTVNKEVTVVGFRIAKWRSSLSQIKVQIKNRGHMEELKTPSKGNKPMTEEEIDQRSLRSTAYHEAGHAVAMLTGVYPEITREISIVPGPNGCGRTAGNYEFSPYLKPDLARLVKIVTVLLAGRTSERCLWGMNGGFDGESRSDLKKAQQWVGSIAPEMKERRALKRWIAAHTKCLVATHWPSIEAVAEALLVEKVLDRDRFMNIVEEFQLLDFLQLIEPIPF